MAAYGSGDQVADQGHSGNLPNFVGELFKLSPLDTPFLSLVGGKSGGRPVASPVFTWQDTLHDDPDGTTADIAEGADANFSSQKRNERRNVVSIFQYGVELSYTKQASTDLLGTSGVVPGGTAVATSILGNQPVQSEMSWQLQIKIEQCALDVEEQFLNGTLAYPAGPTGRQTQGIIGAVAAATSIDSAAVSAVPGSTAGDFAVDRAGFVIDAVAKAMYDEGAPMRNVVLMGASDAKVDTGRFYQISNGTNISPRSYSMFGVNVQDIQTEFGQFPFVLNRHLPADATGVLMLIDLAIVAPRFLPIPGKGHFFLEPLSKLGSYDRQQLYGEIGLEYGPAGWHGKATLWDTISA